MARRRGIDMEKGAEVADVAVVVDGRATAVEAEVLAVGGEEGFDLAGKGVVEIKGLIRHAGCESVCREQAWCLPGCLPLEVQV